MKKILYPVAIAVCASFFALYSLSCIPEEEIQGVITECRELVDQAVANAVDECSTAVDEAVVEAQDVVWQRCSTYYEEEVLPEIERRLQEVLDEAIGDLEAWFELQIDLAKEETFRELGCTEDESSAFGWDCQESLICE